MKKAGGSKFGDLSPMLFESEKSIFSIHFYQYSSMLLSDKANFRNSLFHKITSGPFTVLGLWGQRQKVVFHG